MSSDQTTVVCLHGCCQTAEAFQSYLKSNVLDVGKKKDYGINFHFIEGLFDHPDGGKTWTDPPLVVADIWGRCSDKSDQSNPSSAVPKLEPDYSILEQTFEQLSKAISDTGANTLLGFSQGSFVIYEYMRKTRDPRIKKVIAMSGYTFDNLSESEAQLDVSIMNVYHPFDPIVPKSLAYTNARSVTVLEHNNKELTEYSKAAHVVPSRKPQAREICDFILS